MTVFTLGLLGTAAQAVHCNTPSAVGLIPIGSALHCHLLVNILNTLINFPLSLSYRIRCWESNGE